MYTSITASVIDQSLQIDNLPTLASGGENDVRLTVTFCEMWDGYGKTATFYRDKNKVYNVVLKNDACIIPREVLAEPGVLYMGILGVSGSVVRTTEVIGLNVVQGAITGLAPFEPLPDVYAQVLSAYGATEAGLEEETRARVAADNAEAAARKNEIAVERARINRLASLEAGSTTGDAELQDIRVGYDGTTYTSAGEAVREQIKGLPLAKDAQHIVSGRFEIDQEAGTIKAVENSAGSGYIYTNGGYVWLKNLANTTIDYKAITTALGQDSSWAYVVDTVDNAFAFKRLHEDGNGEPLKQTDIVIFVCMCSPSGVVGRLVNMTNELYFDGVLQPHPSNIARPWNHLVGSLGAKIEIDTVAKTLSMNGIFFWETGMWKNLSVFLDLTTHTIGESGGTVRIILDKDLTPKVTPLEKACEPGDLFICEIFASSTWVFDHTRIYTNLETKALINVDGVPLIPDLKTMGQDVTALKKTTGTATAVNKIFKRVVCVGDSYTSGHILDPDGNHTGLNEDYAWPAYMSRITGAEWVNCGQSGANVLTWQTSGRGLAKAQAAGKVQAYVIGLMINDCGNSVNGIPLGTAADIGTDAQTYYGGMSQIVQKLHAISPEAKIFIQTCPNTGGNFPAYNQAVYDIVETYKDLYPIHCLDLLANIDLYRAASLTGDSLGGHYTAIGYEQFAEILALIMSEYIAHNIEAFQDVAFIDCDPRTDGVNGEEIAAAVDSYLTANPPSGVSDTAIRTAVDAYLTDNPVEAGAVDSVNGKTGAVVLSAVDVGALPNTTKALPNPNTLTIAGQTYDGSAPVEIDLEAAQGEDGGYYTPSVSAAGELSWTASQDGMAEVTTVNIRGPQGEQGPEGKTPVKGADYFTAADKLELVDMVLAAMPDGDEVSY